jgi:hypothetical protein
VIKPAFRYIESIYSLDPAARVRWRGPGAAQAAGMVLPAREADMPQVKVRRRGISAEDAAAVIRGGLSGEQVQVTQHGDRELEVKKGFLVRANVSISDEPGGTVFTVRGGGTALPLLIVTARLVNNRGIARRVADALGQHEGFGEDA